MTYIGVSPSNGVRRVHTYTATGSQTTFTGASSEGITLSYTDANFMDVYQNGVLLAPADYTATSGTSVVLAEGAAASDIVTITVYDAFSVADTVSKSAGGTFDGNVAMAGTLGVTGVLTGTSLDISGDIDIDGTTNLDVVDIDGAVDMASTLGVTGVVTANAGVVVDNITIDGTEIDLSSGDFTLDVEGKIALDANDDGSIKLQDNGTEYARIDGNSSNLRIISQISDKDIIFNGNDGGSAITALTLDMSDGGRAAFGHNADFVDGRGTRFGAGQDLQIYHDGSNSYINDTGTGSLIIRSNRHRIQSDGGENIIEAHADGAVELYYDTSKKLETSSTGVTLTGNLTVTDGHVSSGVTHTYNLYGSTGTGGSASYVTYSFVGDPNTGMFSGTADTIKFATGGSERMRIDSSGALLIGQTSSAVANDGHSFNPTAYAHHTTLNGTVLYLNRRGNNGDILEFRKDNSTVGRIGSGTGRFVISGTNGSSGSGIYFGISQWLPLTHTGALVDNTVNLGVANYRMAIIYAGTGSINTSDRNEKQDIEELTDAEKRVAVVAKGLLRKYRLKDAVAEKGDKARIHFGIIAQDLQDAFTAENLDASKYAMFCSDTWTNDDGSEQTRLGVRYSELLAFIISAI